MAISLNRHNQLQPTCFMTKPPQSALPPLLSLESLDYFPLRLHLYNQHAYFPLELGRRSRPLEGKLNLSDAEIVSGHAGRWLSPGHPPSCDKAGGSGPLVSCGRGWLRPTRPPHEAMKVRTAAVIMGASGPTACMSFAGSIRLVGWGVCGI